MKLITILAILLLTACGAAQVQEIPQPKQGPEPTRSPDEIRISYEIIEGNTAGEEKAKDQLIKTMIDPESTRFSNVISTKTRFKSGRETISVCGEVNSKNSVGQDTGNTLFYSNEVEGLRLPPASFSKTSSELMSYFTGTFQYCTARGKNYNEE